ncbi:hypothetical protein BHE74_00006176 [Ensete ventricosum]|nr:hypothetical protein BHE74_00006176 [Ensete ventricosum]
MAVATEFGGRSCCVVVKRDSSTSLSFSSGFQSKLGFDSSSRSICRQREGICGKRRVLKVRCETRVSAVVEKDVALRQGADGNAAQLSIVMKFGGSSVASAERMKEVAGLILSFPEERPVVVLSAMGKTTNNLLLVIMNYPDDFTNADILEATYPAVAKRLHGDWTNDPAIPIVTGFLGKIDVMIGNLHGVTLLISLNNLQQVWKDVDGVLTCDPNIYPNAKPVPHLTFEEAAELAYFGAQVLHPQSMRPAREGNIPVRVKNSYNPQAPGTVIDKVRDMSKVSNEILYKGRVVIISDLQLFVICKIIVITLVLFVLQVFSIFEDLGISVDSVATSEVSVSLTLDPSKLWSRELIRQNTSYWFKIMIFQSFSNNQMQELDRVVEELEKIAVVRLLQHRSIISLVGNVERSSLILEKV